MSISLFIIPENTRSSLPVITTTWLVSAFYIIFLWSSLKHRLALSRGSWFYIHDWAVGPLHQNPVDWSTQTVHRRTRSKQIQGCAGLSALFEEKKEKKLKIGASDVLHTAPSPNPRSSRSHALRSFGFLSVWPGLPFPPEWPLPLGLLCVYPRHPVYARCLRSSCFNV
jgi:hypothetical protein